MHKLVVAAFLLLSTAAAAMVSYGHLNGGSGNDVMLPTYTYNAQISGGGGTNTISYAKATRVLRGRRVPPDVNVDLAKGRALSTVGQGYDRLYGIQNVFSPDAKVSATIIGDWRANNLAAKGSRTYIDGGPGNDTIQIVNGATAKGGPGADHFIIYRGQDKRLPVNIVDFKSSEGDTITIQSKEVTVIR